MIYRTRTIRSARLQKKKKIMMYLWIILIVGLLMGAFYGLNFLFNHPSLQITEVKINGNTYASEGEIRSLITTTMSENRLLIFPNSNAYFYPKFKTSTTLKKNYPSIKYVDIDIKGRHLMEVNITEYQPEALWCSGMTLSAPKVVAEMSSSTNSAFEEGGPNEAELTEVEDILIRNPRSNRRNNCFLMNEAGYVYGKATSTSNFIAYHGILEGNPLKQLYTTEDFFKNMHRFTKNMEDKLGIETTDVLTRDNSTFIIITDEGAQLFIDKNDDLLDVINNLKTVIEQDAINEAQLENIEYIDLRFGNKVFYKLR